MSAQAGDALQEVLDVAGCEWDVGALIQHYSFVDSLYFSIVLVTTVGYGNSLVPTTPYMRVFVSSYAVYGLLVFGAATFTFHHVVKQTLAIVSGPLYDVGTRLWHGVRRLLALSQATPAAAMPYEPPAVYVYARAIYLNFVSFVALNFTSATVFVLLEEDWSFFDALYHCTMTSTTIGLGDIAPHTQAGRTFAIFHMILSVVVFANAVGAILGTLELRVASTKKSEALQARLDGELISRLDIDGGGVDRAEFVCGMLELVGLVSKADYEPFLAQFAKLDTSGDGRLSREDLQEHSLALAHRQRVAQEAALAKPRADNKGQRFWASLYASATRLTFPSAILCVNFFWHSIFGYAMLLAGLMNGLAIGLTMGQRLTVGTHRLIMSSASVSIALQACAIVLVLLFAFDVRTYFEVDPLTQQLFSSAIDGDGRTFVLDAAAVEQVVEDFVRRNATWEVRAMMIGYVGFLAYGLGCAAHMLVLCHQASTVLGALGTSEVSATAPPQGPDLPKCSPSLPISAGRRAQRPSGFAHVVTALDRAESEPILAERPAGSCLQMDASDGRFLMASPDAVSRQSPPSAPAETMDEGSEAAASKAAQPHACPEVIAVSSSSHVSFAAAPTTSPSRDTIAAKV